MSIAPAEASPPIRIELIQPSTRKSLFDKPVVISLLSVVVSALVSMLTIYLNNRQHSADTQRQEQSHSQDALRQDLHDDFKLATEQFDNLVSENASSRRFALDAFTYLRTRHKDDGWAIANFSGT